ncbi:retrovirus-related Pol polyprotein from transposon 17.6 [Trichonephila clavipes]|nr:retrovirus-related Pol polyprotein from transposon 17.6 [Trichonephila clavipes]
MGFAKETQTDQGTSFTSILTSVFFENFGINVVRSPVYHPLSNPVERFHRTLKRILRVICIESSSEWEKQLPAALFALRTITHESTGFVPTELVHGKNLRTPITLLYENWMGITEKVTPVVEYVFQLINRLKRCQELAIEKMEETKIKRKAWYDKNAIKREFSEGDLVLVSRMNQPNKLSVQRKGPGRIEKKKFRDELCGKTHLVENDIELINAVPIRTKPLRMSAWQTGLLQEEIRKMLKYQGIEIEESDASPRILVETPGRDHRPCIDYRKLNEVIRAQFYPLPTIEYRNETVAAAKYITLIDLTKGYWQIPLTPKAQRLAAFTTSFGKLSSITYAIRVKKCALLFQQIDG